MDVIYPRGAGLDVHKQTVVACAWLFGDGTPRQEVRTFPTTTSGLLALADWLESLGVQHVAMEGHGRVLEAGVARARRPLRAGAGQRRPCQERARAQDRRQRCDLAGRPAGARPGPRQLRATDGGVGTANPDPHAQAVLARARLACPAHRKVLEDANVKLSSFISDVLGNSGRAVLQALVDGQTDPERLASWVGRVTANRSELVEALRG
jgi:transposase